jgi:sulfoxide reductase heme-binding subunit YedZ
MTHRSIVTLKWLVFPACLVPLAHLVYRGFSNTLGPDPVATITHRTGFWTLYFLLISLAITPVRRLHSKLGWLIRFRRMLGLFAFFYGCLHLLTWIWLYSGFDIHAMIQDIYKRPYITAGMAGWICLLVLAVTSPMWMLRRLGGKRWQRIHRLAYVAAVAGVVHYWWIVKSGVLTPWRVTAVLAVLFLARIVWTVREQRRRKLRTAVAV